MRAVENVRLLSLSVLGLIALAACSSSDDGTTTPAASNGASSSSSSSSSGGADPTKTPTGGGGGAPIIPPVVPDAPTDTTLLDVIANPNAPACSGAPGEIYDLQVPPLEGLDKIPLCRGKGRVLLIVNGASHCGYTPQYKPLQALYAKHKDAGLSVLAFPSTSFNQEDTDAATVSDFCTKENGITFPLFAIDIVSKDSPKTGDVAQPVYQWLYAQPGDATQVAWNFEKFLISKDGKLVKRWLSAVSPDDGGEIDLAIQAELVK